MIRTIVAICFLFAVVSARKIPLTTCGDAKGTVTDVDVVPCDSDTCVFKPDMDVTVTGVLTPTIGATSPIIVVEVEVAGFFVTYPGISSDACEFIQCPLKAGESASFKIPVKTLDWLPPMESKMQFHIYESENGAELACAQANIAIEK